jgi:hypothetical protein
MACDGQYSDSLQNFHPSAKGIRSTFKHVEEVVPKGLAFGFTSFALPFPAEGNGAVANFIP